MEIPRGQRMQVLLEELASTESIEVGRCMITDQRGLVVADYGPDNETTSFAAMLSLLAATGYKASENVGMGRSETLVLFSGSNYLAVKSFSVRGRRFQLGMRFRSKPVRRLLRRKPSIQDSVSKLGEISKKAKLILEGR